MRKFWLPLVALLLCLPAAAQYTSGSSAHAGSSFWAAGKTSNLAASTSTASIALSVYAGQVEVYNSTTGIAFITFSIASGPTASAGSSGTVTADYPVAPGAVVVVTPPYNSVYAAAVLSIGSGVVYFTPGVGF